MLCHAVACRLGQWCVLCHDVACCQITWLLLCHDVARRQVLRRWYCLVSRCGVLLGYLIRAMSCCSVVAGSSRVVSSCGGWPGSMAQLLHAARFYGSSSLAESVASSPSAASCPRRFSRIASDQGLANRSRSELKFIQCGLMDARVPSDLLDNEGLLTQGS